MADKEKKPNQFEVVGKRMVKFFIELKSELKKVVWPDRKKLTQSTITVVMICIFAAVLIFTVDKILSGTLNAVGFFPETSSSVTSTAAASNLLPTTAITLPANSVQTSSVVSSSVSSAVSSSAASSTVSAN